MNKTIVKSGNILSTVGLILSLGALPLVCSMTGCASNDTKHVERERSEDMDISSRVRAALVDDAQGNRLRDVNIQTYDNVVTLSGYVNSEEMKRRAGTIARNVSGVKEVVNNIIVRSGS